MTLFDEYVCDAEGCLLNACANLSDFHAKKFLNEMRDVVEQLRRERQADAAEPKLDGL